MGVILRHSPSSIQAFVVARQKKKDRRKVLDKSTAPVHDHRVRMKKGPELAMERSSIKVKQTEKKSLT
jgi:hypothetical protein